MQKLYLDDYFFAYDNSNCDTLYIVSSIVRVDNFINKYNFIKTGSKSTKVSQLLNKQVLSGFTEDRRTTKTNLLEIKL